MKETSRAMYVRSSSYVEVPATRSNSYQAFAKKAAKLLKMEAKKGEELKLFKLNGAVIVDEKIDVGGVSKSWTMGNYLSILAKKSPSQIKIGVGTVKEIESSYTSTSSQVTATLILICRPYIQISLLSR